MFLRLCYFGLWITRSLAFDIVMTGDILPCQIRCVLFDVYGVVLFLSCVSQVLFQGLRVICSATDRVEHNCHRSHLGWGSVEASNYTSHVSLHFSCAAQMYIRSILLWMRPRILYNLHATVSIYCTGWAKFQETDKYRSSLGFSASSSMA